MSTFIRLAAFIGAMLVIAYGFGGTEEQADKVWLLLLLGAGVLLAIAWWPRGTRTLPVFNRTLLRWSAIILVCFTLVSIQLVRVQIVESSRITARIAEAPNGEIASNPRLRLRSLEMQRGRILDSEGRVLADTVQREDGTYERTWPELVDRAVDRLLLAGDVRVDQHRGRVRRVPVRNRRWQPGRGVAQRHHPRAAARLRCGADHRSGPAESCRRVDGWQAGRSRPDGPRDRRSAHDVRRASLRSKPALRQPRPADGRGDRGDRGVLGRAERGPEHAAGVPADRWTL